jgi:hypothetical protein
MFGTIIAVRKKWPRHRRLIAARSALGGGSLFMLAAIALLASASPFTFLPGLAIAAGLFALGLLLMVVLPLGAFLW